MLTRGCGFAAMTRRVVRPGAYGWLDDDVALQLLFIDVTNRVDERCRHDGNACGNKLSKVLLV